MWSDVIANVGWAIGDGCLIDFWNGNWILNVGPLKTFYSSCGVMDTPNQIINGD